MKSVRPATTRGPITGSNLRVVWDDSVVAVVGPKGTTYLERTDAPEATSPSGKYTLATAQGDLVVVKQGGCNCGKPWLSSPSNETVLAGAPQ